MRERLRQHVVEVFRDKEFLAEPRAERLYAARGVEDVAVVGHLAAEVPDLGGHDGPAVRPGLELGRGTVFLDEFQIKQRVEIGQLVNAVALLVVEAQVFANEVAIV